MTDDLDQETKDLIRQRMREALKRRPLTPEERAEIEEELRNPTPWPMDKPL